MIKKILFSFMAVTFLGIAGNLFLVIKLRNIEDYTRGALDLERALNHVERLGETVTLQRERIPRFFSLTDSASRSEFPAMAVRFARDVEAFKTTPIFGEEEIRAIMNNLVESHNGFLEDFKSARGGEVGIERETIGRLTGKLDVLAGGITRLHARLLKLQKERLGALDDGMTLINRTMMSLILLMGLLSTALVIYIARGILSPLRRLLLASRLIGQGQFESPIDAGRADEEIAELIEAFQEMGRQLKKFESHQAEMERFKAAGAIAAGVSHEVNNPLTVITGTTEYLRTAKGAADPELQEGLSVILEEARRISDMTQKLSHLKQFVVGNYSLRGEAGAGPGKLLDIEGSAREKES